MLAWYHQIDDATNLAEVVAITRDYLATWNPQEISLLPEEARPGRIRDEQDVEILHAKVVDEYRMTKATGKALDALQRLRSLLIHAASRIARMRGAEATADETTQERSRGQARRS